MKKHFGTTRPRLLRSLVSVVAVVLVAFGLPLVTMSAASAHTPDLTKSCAGITVSGSYYESRDTNTLGIRIDGGAWTTKTFAVTDSLTVAVPQDGLVHTYAAYVHTTNPNTSYSHDYSGTVGPCGNKHVTAVLWDKTDPTCAADGALVPKTEPTGITVSRTPSSGTGPGHYTITFTAQSGYAIDGPTSQTIDVLPKLTGDQCATVVQPVTPTFTNPACTGPGTGTPGSITLPADGGGITYTKAGTLVTATADGTHKFVALPTGWTLVDAHHATYTVTYTEPSGYPACLVQLPTPVPPVASAPTCDTDGDLVVGTTPHVVTRLDDTVVTADTHAGPGTHELSYTAAAGYTFATGTTKTVSVEVLGKTLDCPATPVSPTVTQSVCTGPGTHTDPVVAFGDVEGDHITYAYDAGTHLVTATPDAGFTLVDLPAGWVSHENGTATYLVTLDDPGPCLVPVDVPTPPAATAPTCSTDGALTVSPTEHVVTTVDDAVVEGETSFGPGEHTIAYAPAEGYTFTGEPVTSVVVHVLPATLDCPASVVSPTVTQSVCTGPGTHSNPVVTLGDVEGDHVSYVYDASSRTVTAKPDTGFALANLPAGWVLQESGWATYVVTLTDPGPCLVVVSPPTTSPTVQVNAPTHHPAMLPNTGGPNAWLALGGLALLLGGGALLVRERRLR
jgi:LPXTG-motif cell wall-anchored protein